MSRLVNRVNKKIVAQEVVVIDQNGTRLGVMSTFEAIKLAQESNLDLVEVGPKDKPPICKIMDFGRFKFESQRKSKQKSPNNKSKEVKFRPVTDIGDYNVKVKRIIKFLNAGARVQITVRFRGREIVHNHLAQDLMDRVLQDVEEYCVVEMPAKLEGRQMVMIIKSK